MVKLTNVLSAIIIYLSIMKLIEYLIKFVICAGLVLLTICIILPINVFDVAIGIVVKLFGGTWNFSTLAAWNDIFDHWSKGEFMF